MTPLAQRAYAVYAVHMSSTEFLESRTSVSVTRTTRDRLKSYMHTVHADSMEEAIEALLSENVIRIPIPPASFQRWKSAAEGAGYTVDQWVAQRVETALTFGLDPTTVQNALRLLSQDRARGDHE